MNNAANQAIGIGSTIWFFDNTHRVYLEKRGGPDYRSYWVPVEIVSETSRSLVTSRYGYKVPKKGEHRGWAFSQHEVDNEVWRNDNRYKIVRLVERCEPETLRAIAELVGFKPDPPNQEPPK